MRVIASNTGGLTLAAFKTALAAAKLAGGYPARQTEWLRMVKGFGMPVDIGFASMQSYTREPRGWVWECGAVTRRDVLFYES